MELWVLAILTTFMGGCFLIWLGHMPRFFKDMPERSVWFKKATYNLCVVEVLFHKEREVICKSVNTFELLAYLQVRFLALKRDIATPNSNWDIMWEYGEDKS